MLETRKKDIFKVMPDTLACRQCGGEFAVLPEDHDFLERVSPVVKGKVYRIPPPTLCPTCRRQRRLTWRNERVLYSRSCDHSRNRFLSSYAPDKPYRVFEHHKWYSETWDPMDYGQDFDFQRSFFEQFDELMRRVPLLGADIKSDNDNCEFTNHTSNNHNCYYIFAASNNEGSLYSTYLQRAIDAVDCFFVFDSERCYECTDCYNSYYLLYSSYCHGCSESYFLDNCRSCRQCFGCVSLTNKEHYFFNEPLVEEEYHQRVAEFLQLPNYRVWALQRVGELKTKHPYKHYAGINNENVTGDHISYSRNCTECFDCTYLEDCSYCTWLHKASDCYDTYGWGLTGELGYENHLVGRDFYNVCFCESCWSNVSNLLYCRYCINDSKNLFGCIGLRHREFCVFNKQYSQAEYEDLIARIIEHMQATGEWGEFFPASISPYGYNESIAMEDFPLSKEEVLERDWKWRNKMPFTTGKETHTWDQIPTSINEVPDFIVTAVLKCINCCRNYRITTPELKFYISMGIPLPQLCFHCRFHDRRGRRNPRQLWKRNCKKCDAEMLSSFEASRPELVYCEECYSQEIG